MSEKYIYDPRKSNIKSTKITGEDMRIAYEENAPVCHHPRRMGTVAVEELSPDTRKTILNDEADDILDEIDKLQA